MSLRLGLTLGGIKDLPLGEHYLSTEVGRMSKLSKDVMTCDFNPNLI